ncbi:hypothetical protein [Flavobacterium sp.]|uniref:hypothetical protein n=1 Tax=Flavobacterium sp. TaxID=239 RepID=UPI00374D44C3
MDLLTIVNAVSPSFDSIKTEIAELKKSNPNKSKDELADLFGNRLRKKYTSVGIASALPSVIPGIGTGVQIAAEITTVSGDLALMLRWMASSCYGIALIYDKDINAEFNVEFIRILGLWCGVIQSAKVMSTKVAAKIAAVQFNKNVSGKVLQKINQKVGTTIVTKYGAKRGGVALGKLIPFGVGAIIGGGFNFYTMNHFKKAAIDYFKAGEDSEYVIYEEI